MDEGEYDLKSIMHYPDWGFAKDYSKPTFTVKPEKLEEAGIS